LELWDLYTSTRQFTGETMRRGEKIPENRYHQVVHICIFNSQGQLLIQQRHPEKDAYPNMWDLSAAGSVTAGEDSQQGAHREVSEELGVNIDFSGIVPAVTATFIGVFDDFYVVHEDLNISDLHLQPEEVQNARWANRDEVFKMINEGSFIPYHRGLLDFLFFRSERVSIHEKR